VFLCVLLVLIAVFNHDKEKPQSPQALVAAAFGDTFRVKEWKPGMGPKPFMYHPAGFNSLCGVLSLPGPTLLRNGALVAVLRCQVREPGSTTLLWLQMRARRFSQGSPEVPLTLPSPPGERVRVRGQAI
ncbi:MAG: hypothetical protein HWN51_07290, partial [Desulfobacterales bacterium]|nr:hypothetical protein [Desulfobacterales bacterium]